MIFHVYIMTNQPRGTLYIGMTSKLIERVWDHKNKITGGFKARYWLDKLIYFEEHATAEYAITREKQLKVWKRAWKIALIEESNPDWIDLYPGLLG